MTIFKAMAACVLVGALAGCGGGRSDRNEGGAVMRLSTGPISRACMASDRKARNPVLCGCIQTVADRSLSSSDQRLAASFFKDPHKAQEIRQSNKASHSAFWRTYKAFGADAERYCA